MAIEWMCPQCARLVARSDRTCDGCSANLRTNKPVRVKGTKVTVRERLRSPWALFLIGAAFFLVFALVSRGEPTLGRLFLKALVAWAVIGTGLVYLSKLSEGLEELIYYRPLAWWRDDPLDSWVLAILIVGLEGLGLMALVIAPSMPAGTSLWP